MSKRKTLVLLTLWLLVTLSCRMVTEVQTPLPPPTAARPVEQTPSRPGDLQPGLTPSSEEGTPSPGVTATALPTEPPPTLPPDVSIPRDPVQPADWETVAALDQAEIPMRDLLELAIRLQGLDPNTPRVVNTTPTDYPVGTRRTFRVSNQDTFETRTITAELVYKTDHLYMWVEEGVEVDERRLARAADTFEQRIYPVEHEFFGSEWSPGVDGDPHLSVLHARDLGSWVAGYYSSADEFPDEVHADSNEMEMFYINADNMEVGSDFYLGTLAHEFQHMIHWYNDRNEDTWINEGFSELASYLTGFDPGGSEYTFALNPDTQLNTWSDDETRSAHYGAAYLFTAYFLDRFGEEATRALVAHPENGIAAVDAVLAELGTGITFEDLFADWVVANYLDDPRLGEGRFGYEEIDPPGFWAEESYDRYPVEQTSDVAQYATDYIELEGDRDLVVEFIGATRTRLVNTDPHSGDYFWYSNRGDDADMRLTRAFDLTGLEKATLRFWTWYDIEEDWDYAYVEVSTDGGKRWEILRGPSSTDTNPNGNSFGWAYTGKSGDGPVWIEEVIDLSPYAGQPILLRFEYVEDDALNYPGWAIDDIQIPELGFFDDVEGGENGWQAEGFVRTNNFVPQRYLVQLITFGDEVQVQRLPLSEDQRGRWEVPLASARLDRAVLTISGLAPVTTERAPYYYAIRER